jgi:UV DNA damage repair endonuclease
MTDELLEESDIIPVAQLEGIDLSNVEAADLDTLKELGDSLNELNTRVVLAEEEVSKLKTTRKKVAEELIPDLMSKVGLKLVELEDGTKIKVDEFVDARIRDANVAFEWLRETNNESIIKNQISVSLGRGDDDRAQQVLELLKENDVEADHKITVHNQTLKAFCRDALDNPELAESLPREAFGIYQGKRAKITQ